MSMTRIAQTAGMDPNLINQVLPWLFGTVYDVPALPVCVPVTDALSVAMTADDPADGGVIKLSTRAVFDRFPTSGRFQIDQERGTYSGKYDATMELLNVTRAQESTEAGPHEVGASVIVPQDLHKYAVCENPGQGAYLCKSVPAVKINGILKPADEPPVHTVNLDDRSLIPGTSVVSVTFDMSPESAAGSPYLFWGFTTDPVTGATTGIEYRVGHYGSGATPPPTVVPPELITSTLLQSTGISGLGFVPGSFGPPPSPEPVPGPQIGVVTVDVSGALDDGLGTITGTAGLQLSTPAHIVKLLLIEAFELTGFDATSWADTIAQQQSRGYSWSFRFLPFSLDRLLALCQVQGRAAIFREQGVWKAVFRRRGAVTHTFDSRNLIDPVVDWSPIENILTAFDVTYGGGSRLDPLALPRVDSDVGLNKYGLRRAPLDLPWVTSDRMALDLARYWLSLQDRQRLETSFRAPGWEALPVARYDLSEVDTAVTRAYSVRRMPFRVRGAKHNLDTREVALSMSEDQPPAIDLDARYAVIAASAAGPITLGARYAIAAERKTATDSLVTILSEVASVPTLHVRAADVLAVQLSEVATATTST